MSKFFFALLFVFAFALGTPQRADAEQSNTRVKIFHWCLWDPDFETTVNTWLAAQVGIRVGKLNVFPADGCRHLGVMYRVVPEPVHTPLRVAMIWHGDVLTLEDQINAAMSSMRYVADTGFDGTIYYILHEP